jgi:hypothetical protein
MKRNGSSVAGVVRFGLRLGIVAIVVGVLLTGCDMVTLFEDEPEDRTETPPERALPALESLVLVVQLVTESDSDDPMMAAYPTGMTLQAGNSAEELSISLANCHLQPTSDACLSGDFDVARTTTSSTATISYSGSATMTGCDYSSGTIDVAATFSYDPISDTQGDEPQEVTGSVTLDGTQWEFSAVLDALEVYQEDRTIDPVNVPCRARFFAAGSSTDRWTTGAGGTLVYSPDGEEWAPMWIDEEVSLSSIAAAADGSMVAVSAESIDWMPQGAGTIWHSTNGDDWTKVHSTDTGHAFAHVAWSGGLWVAVGSGGALAISADGSSWSDHFIPVDVPEQSVLWEIAPGEDATGAAIWVLAGGRRMEDGQGGHTSEPIWWYISHADLSTGPQFLDWTAVGMDAFQDVTGMDAPPSTFKAITWDPGTGDWIGAPLGGPDDTQIVYWDGVTNTPELSLTPSDETESQVQFMGDLEVVGLSVVADSQQDQFYRFALEQYYGDGVIHRSVVDAGSATSWTSQQITTSYITPLFHVAAGLVSGSDAARSVLISGGGDIWVSSDYGIQWNQVKYDWYGVRGLTYRP